MKQSNEKSSAKEARLIGLNNQPYMSQWWEETKKFQVMQPGKTVGRQVVTSAVNGVGKVFVGANTIIDRTIDTLTNPKSPEPLRNGDLLPRTQRDVRQLFNGIFSKDAIEHPVGTLVASAVRVINIGTSAITDSVQKLGGGSNVANNNYTTAE